MTEQVSRLVVEIDSGPAQSGSGRVVASLAKIESAAIQADLAVNKATKNFNSLRNSSTNAASGLNKTATSLNKVQTSGNRAQRTLNTTSRRLVQVERHSRHASKSISFLAANFKILRNLYITKRFLEGIVAIGGAFVQARLEADKMKSTMMAVTGTAGLAAEELMWLRETADDMGTSFLAISTPYAKMAAAAKGTSLEGQKLRDIFVDITKATTTLHMSGDELKFTFMALTQMLSKSTVSMEELKRQLGERIPGVLHDAAKAAGFKGEDAVDKLAKAIKAGAIQTEKWLEPFAKLIGERYAEGFKFARVALQSELNRMGNAWFGFKSKMSEGKVEEEFILLINRVVEQFRQLEEKANGLGDTLADVIKDVTFAFELLFNTNYIQEFLNTDGWDRLYAKVNEGSGVFEAFFSDLSTGFSYATETILAGLRSIPDFIILVGETLGTLVAGLVIQFEDLNKSVNLIFERMRNWATKTFSDLWTNIQKLFASGIESILRMTSTAFGKIAFAASLLDPFVPGLDNVTKALSDMEMGTHSAANSIKVLGQKVETEASTALEKYSTKVSEITQQEEKLALAKEQHATQFNDTIQKSIATYNKQLEANKKGLALAKEEAEFQLDWAKNQRADAKMFGSEDNPFAPSNNVLDTDASGSKGGSKGGRAKANKEAASTQREYNKALKDYNKLLGESDYKIEALNEYKKGMEQLTTAVKLGIGTQDEYNKIIKQLKYEYKVAMGEMLDYEKVFKDGLKSFADGFATFFVDSISDGKASFNDLVESVVKGMAKMMLEMQMMRLMGALFPQWFGPGAANFGASVVGANGLTFNNGSVVPMANGGLITKPTLFPMANGGLALGGEAGTEAIMPLTRRNGKLGVEGSNVTVITNIHNNSNSNVREEKRQDSNGNTISDIFIEEMQNAFSSGRMDDSMSNNYGAVRRGF